MVKSVSTAGALSRKPNLDSVRAAGHDTLRLVNSRILLSILSDRQPISRAELAKVSGLNKATVSMITGKLLRDRYIVEEGGAGRTTPIGGKPPTPLRLNPLRHGLFGLDVRADETILALADFNSRIVARASFETGADAREFLEEIGREIKRLRQEHAEFIDVAGLGVSLPGPVNSQTGKFLASVVLPWRDVPVVEWLEESSGLPVTIDNSARCAALAEIWHGKALAQARNLLYVGVSAGLACGIVIDGALYRGGNTIAGQFGHVMIDPNGPECRCGQRGCWDLYASEKATVARYQQLRGAQGRRAPSMRKLIELVESGDPAATEAVSETARYLGIGITGLINGLDPDVVVVGGEITKAWGLVEPLIKAETAKSVLAPREQPVAIRRSTFDVRPSLKGALTLV